MRFQIPVFTLSDSTDAASVRRQQTISRIRDCSPLDQENALAELHREAKASAGDEKAWNDLALGLFEARHFDEACELFRKLAEAFPDHDFHRLNVATCYSQMAQLDLCQYELEQVKNSGHTEEGRRTATKLLEGLSQWRGTNARDQQFASLQISALRERTEAGEADPEDYVQLARLLLQREFGDLAQVDAATNEARQILERGEKRYPEAVPILEHLALVYFRTPGADNQINAVLEKLQRIAPDSPALCVGQSASDEEAEKFSERMRSRAYELMEHCQSKDPPLIEASLRELQKMVAMFAQSPEYRKVYAFALMIAGRKEEARREAEILASFGDDSHDMEFHLGQIFSSCGDGARGLHLLQRALRSAPTEEDRDQTRQLIAQYEQRADQPS
jgi:Flp pilus assembly protein TadD